LSPCQEPHPDCHFSAAKLLTHMTVPWSQSFLQAAVPAHNGASVPFLCWPIVAIPSGRNRRCGDGIRWPTRLWRVQARPAPALFVRSTAPLCLLCIGQDARMRDGRLAGKMLQQCPLPLLERSGPKSFLPTAISTPRIASLKLPRRHHRWC
jgi:hypothetical protein